MEILRWVTSNADLIAAFLVMSGLVSGVVEVIKKWLGGLNKLTLAFVHYAVALIPLAIHYIQGVHANSPLFVALQGLIVVGTNQFLYPAVVKPISQVFSDAKAMRDGQALDKLLEQNTNKVADFAG